MVGWLVGFLTSSSTTRLYRGRAPRQERLTILCAATHETELGDHDFCLSRSHYTDTDPTSRERAATAGIEPGSSSPGVARSTAELPRPPRSDDESTDLSPEPEQHAADWTHDCQDGFPYNLLFKPMRYVSISIYRNLKNLCLFTGVLPVCCTFYEASKFKKKKEMKFLSNFLKIVKNVQM